MQSFTLRSPLSKIHNLSHDLPVCSTLPANAVARTVLHVQPRNRPTRHALPAAWYRAGTSKGLFIGRQHLPKDESLWRAIILSAMGSQDGDVRQLNGIGGGSPTTSKVAIVERSSRNGIDLEYTFVQVVPDDGRLDMTGNCGNIASGVGPFALDEGIITVPSGQERTRLRILNTNTNKVMEAVIHLDTEGHAYEQGSYKMPGLRTGGSPIEISFLNPSGSMTGKMFPSGHEADWIYVSTDEGTFSVRATLIDVANPFVLVDATTLPEVYQKLSSQAHTSPQIIEGIRRASAVMMGLAKDTKEAAKTRGTPKIAILSQSDASADIRVTSFSAGRLHPSVQLTGAVCIAAALATSGTVACQIASRKVPQATTSTSGSAASSPQFPNSFSSPAAGVSVSLKRRIRIAHASGTIDAKVCTSIVPSIERISIDRVMITRTARRLFGGNVFYESDAATAYPSRLDA